MSFSLGIAAEVFENDNNKVTLAFETSHPNDNLEKFGLGAEYWWKNMIALRAGFKSVSDSAGSFAEIPGIGLDIIHYNFGAGIKIPISSHLVKVDYSLGDRGWFELEHRFSLGMEF